MKSEVSPVSEGGGETLRSRRRAQLLVLLVVLVAAASALLGVRTYRTFVVLDAAYEAGVPQASSIRPWMTLRFVADTYGVPEAALREQLGLSPETPSRTTLKSLAERTGVPRLDYVRRVQRAIAAGAPAPEERGRGKVIPGWLDGTGDALVSAVLVYGYIALAVLLLLGALGVPLPSGIAMVVAGSLAAQGQMNAVVLALVATAASLAGDMAGYALGRLLGAGIVERKGRWLGLTPDRRARAERLVERWGMLSVFLSRSLVSFLSPAVNVVAGAGRYRLGAFVAAGIVGRLVWSVAYLGLGYIARGGLEPAADFLASLSGLLVALAILGALSASLRA